VELGIIHQGKLHTLKKSTRELLRVYQQPHVFDVEETKLKISDLELIYVSDCIPFTAFSKDFKEEWYLNYQLQKGFECFWLKGEEYIRRYEVPTQADYACFLSLVDDLKEIQCSFDRKDRVHFYNRKILPIGSLRKFLENSNSPPIIPQNDLLWWHL